MPNSMVNFIHTTHLGRWRITWAWPRYAKYKAPIYLWYWTDWSTNYYIASQLSRINFNNNLTIPWKYIIQGYLYASISECLWQICYDKSIYTIEQWYLCFPMWVYMCTNSNSTSAQQVIAGIFLYHIASYNLKKWVRLLIMTTSYMCLPSLVNHTCLPSD